MYRSISGELVYTCVSVLWTDDTAHCEEPLPKNGFSIILDPSGLFHAGASFDRDDTAITLYLGDWPEGTVFRDIRDGNWYRVVEYTTRQVTGEVFHRQKLRCIFDTCELVPRSNSGSFERRNCE